MANFDILPQIKPTIEELAKGDKSQDMLLRFIIHYLEKQGNWTESQVGMWLRVVNAMQRAQIISYSNGVYHLEDATWLGRNL